MASTGAIPRTKKAQSAPPVTSLHHDTQILVGQEASEPLDIKLLTVSSNGVQTKMPALHKSWCCARELIHYVPPPSEGLEVPGALDAWLEQMDFFKQDLEWMLSLPHHRFWSELVYERKVHKCLISYLSQAPRSHDDTILQQLQQEHRELVSPVLASIYRLVLLVHCRIATYKESATCHINPQAWGELLYQHFILDLCQILDLCSIYYPSNSALLTKMIGNIFTHQPRYMDDIELVVKSIHTALENVEHTLGVSDSVSAAVSLNSVASSPSLDDQRAIVLFLHDTFHTLHNFVMVHPSAAHVLHRHDLHIRLALCYERVMQPLSESLSRLKLRPPSPGSSDDEDDDEGLDRLLARLLELRITTLSAFRAITEAVCLAPLQQHDVSGQVVSESLESYMHVVSSCLAEKTFIADYHNTYSFTADIDLFKSRSSDAMSVQFIEDALRGVLEEAGLSLDAKVTALTNGHSKGPAPSGMQAESASAGGDSSGMSQYAASGSAEVDAVQLAELVSSVHDIMPDLGAGFVTRCLKHYRYSSEAVINALLEGSLPAELLELDQSMPATAEDLPQLLEVEGAAAASKTPAQPRSAGEEYCDSYEQAMDAAKQNVMDRANIYNDDEFDVFSRPKVDLTKVHRGKKNKIESGQDEAVKQKVRALGNQYAERHGRSIYEEEFDPAHLTEEEDEEVAGLLPVADYNDEYDDTYDDNEAGNMDASTEIMMPRRKVISKARPTIFGQGSLNAALSNGFGSDLEEEEDSSSGALTMAAPGRALPTEENEEEFIRRRGLRKGLGGEQFMLELRESGGVINNRKVTPHERNLPASHVFQNNQRKRQNRFLPRDNHRDHHKPLYVNQCKGGDTDATSESNATNTGAEDEEGEEQQQEAGPRLSFTPFCEDPAVTRQRQADRWASRDQARNRGGNQSRRQQGRMPPPQPLPVNGFDGNDREPIPVAEADREEGGGRGQQGGRGGGARPKTYTNKSGKSWRHGTDDEAQGSRGGKWKEDTNHGSAQDPNYRRKMENKNKFRKQAAQNKFNRNN